MKKQELKQLIREVINEYHVGPENPLPNLNKSVKSPTGNGEKCPHCKKTGTNGLAICQHCGKNKFVTNEAGLPKFDENNTIDVFAREVAEKVYQSIRGRINSEVIISDVIRDVIRYKMRKENWVKDPSDGL